MMTDFYVHAAFIVPEERLDHYLGVGYLQAALAKLGMTSIVLQGPPERIEPELDQLLSRARPPRWVGIACLYLFSDRAVGRIARYVKARSASVRIVVGGHGATFDWELLLSTIPEIDFVVRGEADEALPLLCEGREPLTVPGVASRDERELPQEALNPRPIADVDALPMPVRDTLRQVIARRTVESTLVPIVGSRGCYAACEFCSMVSFYSLDGHPMRWRPRRPESIAAEIGSLVKEYGVRRFWFVDDEFIGPPRSSGPRLQRLAELLAPLGIEFGFDARSSGVAVLSAANLEGLRAAGLRVVSMGLESGSQTALDRMNKGLSVRSNWEAIRRLRSAGIEHRYGFIMYDLRTTPQDLRNNLAFLRFAEPHRICNAGAYRLLNAEFPEVGSPLYRKLHLTGHRLRPTTPPDLPRLDEDELGYFFEDARIRQYRRMVRRLAGEAVEPAMVDRRLDSAQPGWDVWFGINKHPRNVAVMGAFLAAHEWLLERVDSLEEESYPELRGHFLRELSARRPR